MEGADGTSINTNHLACTWGVKRRGEENIKGEGGSKKGGSRNQERKTVPIRNQICNQLMRNI